MKALATRRLLKDNEIDFFRSDDWPAIQLTSICEHIVAIMRDRVNGLMLQETIHRRIFRDVSKEKVNEGLQNMSVDSSNRF